MKKLLLVPLIGLTAFSLAGIAGTPAANTAPAPAAQAEAAAPAVKTETVAKVKHTKHKKAGEKAAQENSK